MPSCQFSLYPLGEKDLSPTINAAIQELKKSGLQYEMGNMSTIVYGGTDEIFAVLKNMYEAISNKPAVMTFTLSNACPVPKKN